MGFQSSKDRLARREVVRSVEFVLENILGLLGKYRRLVLLFFVWLRFNSRVCQLRAGYELRFVVFDTLRKHGDMVNSVSE